MDQPDIAPSFIPIQFSYRAALLAGILAGSLFLGLELLAGLWFIRKVTESTSQYRAN